MANRDNTALIVDNNTSRTPAHKPWTSAAASPPSTGGAISMRRETYAVRTIQLRIEDAKDIENRFQVEQSQDTASRRDVIMKHDWRRPLPGELELAPVDAKDVMRSNREYRPGPRTPGGCLYDDLNPGTIVWHWDIRPRFNAEQVALGWTAVEDAEGRAMIQKGRYYVIVENLPRVPGKFEVMEAPVYTNNNTGMRLIPAAQHGEHFSLCPLNIHESRFENLVPQNPLSKIDWIRTKPGSGEHSKMKRLTMLVRWSDVKKFDLNIEEVRVVGALDDDSRDALCQKIERANMV